LRVHELAKELELSSKAAITLLTKLGIEVKSHASNLAESDVRKVLDHMDSIKVANEKQTEVNEAQVPVEENEVEDNGQANKKKSEEDDEEEEEKPLTVIEIENENITVKEFSAKINVPVTEVITKLIKKGIMLNLNQNMEIELAEEIALEYEIVLDFKTEIKTDQQKRVEDAFLAEVEEEVRFLKVRPPIVTVMGHVDHGKTKLLDAIRRTNVVDKEAGGITQHIGAYQVHVHEKDITFIDTPGHEAFTEIRARGAHLTDIVILVVAADDGIMPQTVEAIHHAKAAKVPIIVAINKMDKPDANPERIKQQLTEHDMLSEEWGGQTIVVPVSAIDGTGLKELLEMIILVSEMEELKANPHKKAVGIVLESKLTKNRGPVATVLIKSGTLRGGQPFVIGPVHGKVRAIFDDAGNKRKDATPSMPVEIMGLSGVPNAGDVFQVVSSDKESKKIADSRAYEVLDAKRKKKNAISLEEFSQRINEEEITTLNLVVKADVIGSLEAIINSINKIKVENANINIIHTGTGALTESDLMLAKASDAMLVGFNVLVPMELKSKAEEEGIIVKLYHIIYQLLENITAILKGLLKPRYERVKIGTVEVRSLFKFSKVGIIAGCFVTEGKVIRGSEIEVYRGSNMIYEGDLTSLKRFKDDVREVQNGYECGIVLEGYDAFEEKDYIQVFLNKEIVL